MYKAYNFFSARFVRSAPTFQSFLLSSAVFLFILLTRRKSRVVWWLWTLFVFRPHFTGRARENSFRAFSNTHRATARRLNIFAIPRRRGAYIKASDRLRRGRSFYRLFSRNSFSTAPLHSTRSADTRLFIRPNRAESLANNPIATALLLTTTTVPVAENKTMSEKRRREITIKKYYYRCVEDFSYPDDVLFLDQ